jgi:hypothetical protein
MAKRFSICLILSLTICEILFSTYLFQVVLSGIFGKFRTNIRFFSFVLKLLIFKCALHLLVPHIVVAWRAEILNFNKCFCEHTLRLTPKPFVRCWHFLPLTKMAKNHINLSNKYSRVFLPN